MVMEKREYVNFLILVYKYGKLKNMVRDVDAYILAGGQSSRMGRNKALLSWDGRYMIEHVYDSTRRVFENVHVVVKKDSEIGSLNLPFVFDAAAEYCPMIGIYTALRHTAKQHVFIKACDNSCLEEGLVLMMLSLKGQADIIIAETSDGVHPLFAVYSKVCLPHIENMVAQANYRITGFYDRVNVYYIRENEIKAYDPDMRSLININTPDEFRSFKKPSNGMRRRRVGADQKN